jgi:hypothetical protein
MELYVSSCAELEETSNLTLEAATFFRKQNKLNKLNSTPWPLVRERTIQTERPPHVGEVSANVCRYRVSRGQRGGSPRPYYRFSIPEPLLFLPRTYSIILTRLCGPRSGPTTSQKIW